MPKNSLKIGIIGAGIGGLALAVSFRKIGFKVTVFERSKSISEFGAGVQLSPNGMKVLRYLDVEEKIIEVSSFPERILITRAEDNNYVSQIPLGMVANKRYGASFLQIHRSDLVSILYDKAKELGVNFSFGEEAVVKSTEFSASIISCGRTDFNFDLAVAADGVHSINRKNFFQFAEPKFLKQVAYRATVPLSKLDQCWKKPQVQIFLGSGKHVVAYPIRSKELLNVVFCSDEDVWNADGWSNIADPAQLSEKFRCFICVEAILSEISSVHKWGLLGYQNWSDWHQRTLALLGDSCHPMLPYLAQGANQALEDVASITYFLSKNSESGVASALALYGKHRRRRVRKVQKAAWRNAKLYHLKNGPKRLLLHSTLNLASRIAPNLLLKQFDWLYNYDVPM